MSIRVIIVTGAIGTLGFSLDLRGTSKFRGWLYLSKNTHLQVVVSEIAPPIRGPTRRELECINDGD